DTGLMAFIDEMTEFVRTSVATRRRVIICDLITPRPFKRMFRDRQQLDVRITQFQNVREQRLGELEIAEGPISFFRFAAPRTEMHFVNADRIPRPFFFATLLHPMGVAP